MFTGSEILLVITVMAERHVKVKSPLSSNSGYACVGGFVYQPALSMRPVSPRLDRSGSENITIRLNR